MLIRSVIVLSTLLGTTFAYAESFRSLSCFNNSAAVGWTITSTPDSGFEVAVNNYGSASVASHFGLPGILIDIVSSLKDSSCTSGPNGHFCLSDFAQVRSHTFDPDSGNWIPTPFHNTYNLMVGASPSHDDWTITLRATNVESQEIFFETFSNFQCRINNH